MNRQEKPTVFISFNINSSDFVNSLERKLSKVANVIRYENSVPPWGRFTSFMDTIKEQDFAVLVISDAYLKSYACMYEVLRAMESPNWKNKVLIAKMTDVKPGNDDERVKYLHYWKEQYDDLNNKLTSLPSGSAESLIEKRGRIKLIVDSMDQFLAFIADSNCPKIYNVIEEICERVKISTKSVFTYTNENGMSENIRRLYVTEYIRDNPGASVSEIAEAIGISQRSVLYHIRQLTEIGVIDIKGPRRMRKYFLAQK